MTYNEAKHVKMRIEIRGLERSMVELVAIGSIDHRYAIKLIEKELRRKRADEYYERKRQDQIPSPKSP